MEFEELFVVYFIYYDFKVFCKCFEIVVDLFYLGDEKLDVKFLIFSDLMEFM